MEEAKGKSKPWIYLGWGFVFLAACLVAFIAWVTMGDLKLQVFQVGTRFQELDAQITRMQEHYSNLANEQKELLEVWGLAALILGISGGVASVLRAPQAVIVVFGGFTALIYGTTKIYDPQLATKTLNSARSQLACVKPRVLTLASLSTNTRPAISPALSDLVSSLQPLQENSATFNVQMNLLNEQRGAHQEERNAAITAIDQALLQPVRDLSYELQTLEHHKTDISAILFEVEFLNNKQPSEELSPILIKARSAYEQVSVAINTLMRLQTMENRLIDETRIYRELETRSASRLVAGQTLSQEALSLSQSLPGKIDKLRNWPFEFEDATSYAHKVVNDIQNQVVNTIASSGIANNSIQDIVVAATGLIPTASPKEEPFDAHMVSDHVVQGEEALAQMETPADMQAIIRHAFEVIHRTELVLEDYTDKLDYANNKILELDRIIIDHLPVISSAVKKLQSTIGNLDFEMSNLQHNVDEANRAQEQANDLLSKPDPARLKIEIESCIKV